MKKLSEDFSSEFIFKIYERNYMKKGYKDLLIIVGVVLFIIFLLPGIGLILPYHYDFVLSYLFFITTWIVSRDLIIFTDNINKRNK